MVIFGWTTPVACEYAANVEGTDGSNTGELVTDTSAMVSVSIKGLPTHWVPSCKHYADGNLLQQLPAVQPSNILTTRSLTCTMLPQVLLLIGFEQSKLFGKVPDYND